MSSLSDHCLNNTSLSSVHSNVFRIFEYNYWLEYIDNNWLNNFAQLLIAHKIPAQYDYCTEINPVQHLWLHIAQIPTPYDEEKIQSLKSVIRFLHAWLNSVSSTIDVHSLWHKQFLHTVFQILAILMERDEDLIEYFIRIDGESNVLNCINIIHHFSTPFQSRLLQCMKYIVEFRVESRMCLNFALQKQYTSVFKHLFTFVHSLQCSNKNLMREEYGYLPDSNIPPCAISTTHVLKKVKNTENDDVVAADLSEHNYYQKWNELQELNLQLDAMGEIMYCFNELTQPRLNLLDCATLMDSLSPKILLLFIEMSTKKPHTASRTTLKRIILAQSIIGNILYCPSAWTHHCVIFDSRWMDRVIHNVHRMFDHTKKRNEYRWFNTTIQSVLHYVLIGQSQSYIRLIDKSSALFKLCKFAEKQNISLQAEHSVFMILVHLAEHCRPSVLLTELLGNQSLHGLLKNGFPHHQHCQCNLFPHKILPVIHRILTQYPWITSSSLISDIPSNVVTFLHKRSLTVDMKMLNVLRSMLLDVLQKIIDLNGNHLAPFKSRAKLLLDRHFSNGDYFYNVS